MRVWLKVPVWACGSKSTKQCDVSCVKGSRDKWGSVPSDAEKLAKPISTVSVTRACI